MFGSLSFRLVPLWEEEGDGSFVTETLGVGEGELDGHTADGRGIWGGVLGRKQLKQVPGPASRKQQEAIQICLSVRLSTPLNIYICTYYTYILYIYMYYTYIHISRVHKNRRLE